MRSESRSRTAPRYLAAALVISLALTLPGGATLAADAEEEGSLCSTISLEQLAELGPPGFDSVLLDSARFCAYGPSPEGGTPTLSLVIIPLSFQTMMATLPDVTDISVGDRAAAVADGVVHVDFGDEILSIQLDLGSGGTDSGIDAVEYAIDVAEIVVPARESALGAAGATVSAAGSSLVAPPEVAGIEWARNQEIVSAAEMIERDPEQAAIWQVMLDATGADASELFLLSVNARDESGAIIGNYGAVQIVGAEESALRTAFLDLMRATSEGDVSLADLTLGGKDVLRLMEGQETRGYLYLDGDIAHTFTMSEEETARLLEALP